VSTVRFDVAGKRRNGVCSTFLADSERDSFVPVFVKRAAHFRLPADPWAAVIMIGAGTGVAPFIGFLEERRARGDGGRNWLFFGEQRRSTDHYYANELDAFRADGVLHHLDVAFSRDQPHRVYVQHRICEQGARLWAWLEGGAHVYVCGDMNGMAKGVHAALHDLVALHGGMSVEEADAYLRHLAETGRYSRDVY
jgi:sulfite reductase (NADPH) flavoprotein alpha-component